MPVVIGRAAEQKRLLQLAREAADSRGAVLFVSGELGIGKTFLVEETLAKSDLEFPVVRGR